MRLAFCLVCSDDKAQRLRLLSKDNAMVMMMALRWFVLLAIYRAGAAAPTTSEERVQYFVALLVNC